MNCLKQVILEGKKKASSPSPVAAASPSTNPSSGTSSQRPSNPSSSSGSSLPKIEPNQPAGNEYKVPEYFQHDKDTYAELMAQMQKQRLPRPVKPDRG